MNYPYANGIIKAIEGNLFDKAKFAKLAKTERRDFVAVLSGFGYGAGVTGDSLERVLDAELKHFKQGLMELSPERRYANAFYLTYDAMNLKLLYKAKLFGVNRPDVLSDLGAIDVASMQAFVLENDGSKVSQEYAPLLKAVANAVKGIDNPRLLSARIDAEVFEYLFDTVRFCPGGSLPVYYKGFVDFANVISLIRSKMLKWDYPSFAQMVIKGGLIPVSEFAIAYPLEGEAFAKAFQAYYGEKITRLLKKHFEHPDLDRLERKFDALLLETVSVYRNDAFNIGPMCYYFLKKQAEAKNIRTLYANGTADLSDLLEY